VKLPQQQGEYAVTVILGPKDSWCELKSVGENSIADVNGPHAGVEFPTTASRHYGAANSVAGPPLYRHWLQPVA
jgi:hypothetical protein